MIDDGIRINKRDSHTLSLSVTNHSAFGEWRLPSTRCYHDHMSSPMSTCHVARRVLYITRNFIDGQEPHSDRTILCPC